MNKAEFIEALAARLSSDKKKAGEALDAVLDEIYAVVVKGEKLTLTGFGSFERRERGPRIARNPATGATVKVKKTAVPAFKAGAEFKAIVSGAKKLVQRKPAAPAKPAAAKVTAAAKAAPAKAAAKAPAKKAAPVKKAAPAKAAAKAPAKKAPAKKAPAKKAPAKKA